MSRVIILISFFCFLITGHAQIVIKGIVEKNEGIPVANASISVRSMQSVAIISYAITDQYGKFILSITSKEDSLILKVTHVGLNPVEMRIKNDNAELTIGMVQGVKKLEEIIIKSPPVYLKKDTLNYSTGSFISKEDRVIADVLKKLPGIEVQADGKVLYQGKPIQKFYVDGLDLMEGGYNLINNNLPANSVSKIQVIENDQPIKVLDSLVFSDKASLNLQLKNVAFTGTAKLGAGMHPILWDVNFTPMLFTKKVQTINSYQANNTGRNISNDIEVLTSDGFSDQSAKLLFPFLSIDQVVIPSIDNKYWLRNNTHLLSFNVLKKINKKMQLKLNVSMLNDNQIQSGYNQVSFLTPSETITLQQIQQTFTNKNLLRVNLITENNADDAYVKNTTQFRLQKNAGQSGLLTNSLLSGQLLKADIWEVRNRINGIKKIGRQLVAFNSNISFLQTPQQLTFKPLVFDSIFNNKEVQEARQYVVFSNFHTDNSLGITKKIGRIILIPRVGVSFHRQLLTSFIDTLSNNIPLTLNEEFRNNRSFTQTTQYIESSFQYNTAFWKSGMSLPIRIRQFHFNNYVGNTYETVNRLVFEPSAYLMYKKIRFTELVYNFAVNNNFGTITEAYTGYIIRNFRTVMRYPGFLPQGKSVSNGIMINYRNPLSYLFLSTGYSFTLFRKNMITNNFIDSTGIAVIGNVYENNNQLGHFISINGSKFFKTAKLLLKINTSLNLRSQLVNLNSSKSLLKNKFYNMQIAIGHNSNKYYSFNYNNSFVAASGSIAGRRLGRSIMQQHNLDVNVFIPVNHTITISANYYSNSFHVKNRQLLLNLLYRYTLPKSKIDIEVACNNLLNEKSFTSYTNDLYSNVFNSFLLRPRQVLCTVKVSF